MDAPISLPAGAKLHNGRYQILNEINRGATAVVYAATDAHTGQQVALKVMNCASHGASQVPVKVVKREIAFSTGVTHDNIVKLLDVFAEKTQLVIVWELISGPDLLDLLNEHHGTMPEGLAAFYFCQLLKAVMFMHDNGFCHRDIKPENAMVQRHNHQLKLIDFGLSKHLESARTRGVGTPDYLAPEMLQVWNVGLPGGLMGGPTPYDARAVDAWALGVLMYLLVTGKYPFEDPQHPNNLPYTIQNVLAGRIRPFPQHVSQGCRNLITNLLRLDPNQRTTLKELTRDEWLVSSAYTCASSLGRLDLLAGLQTDPTPTHTSPHRMQHPSPPFPHTPNPFTPAQAACTPAHPQQSALTASLCGGPRGPSVPATTCHAQATAAAAAATGVGTTLPLMGSPVGVHQSSSARSPVHAAVLQGWPTGQVIASYPAGDADMGDEDDRRAPSREKDTLWQRLKRKLA